jgi:acetoacetyl-CoA synthetase
MTRLLKFINKRYKKKIRSYKQLYHWSIENISDFWSCIWDFCEIKSSEYYRSVLVDSNQMIGSKWFEGSRLNFAENLLRYRDEKSALIFKRENGETTTITYAELYDQTARLAKSMREMGVCRGDRVVGFMPNMTETVVAMLATTSIGAVWSSCSPDFGVAGALDRFTQAKPILLFTADRYFYNGKSFDCLERAANIVGEINSIQKTIIVPYNTRERADISRVPNAVHYKDFLSKDQGLEILFEQVPFDHSVYIMYTSGTTDLPKCMAQGSGVLLNHLKELKLHTDVKREDIIFYYTTCGWMMWNWLISSLALGATIVLYDGSAFYPDSGALWKLAQDEQITIFGASAKYFSEIEKRGLKPGKEYDFKKLKTILSTGSPLSEESFRYIYQEIKKYVMLSSIAGGTDINGCFALGNPILPVRTGELQCRGLGMKVEVFDSEGNSIVNQQGELVCTAPFPSMPLYFLNDKDHQKYKDAYFRVYPGVWRHGDYAEITENEGMVIYGRSDATLNPGGIRIGTAEIYRIVESIKEVADSVVIDQQWKGDVRVVLFVKLKQGMELTERLVNKIKIRIRKSATPRHVPAKIIAVPDIPYTINMKKVELAVKNIIHGKPVKNLASIINPKALNFYKNIVA